MRFAVCDNQQKFVYAAQKALREYVSEKGESCDVEAFTDPDGLLARCRETRFDAIVLDVQMPRRDGIETAREIGRMQPNTPIIFVTAFIQYAPRGYEVNAFRYVLKQDFEATFPDALDALWKKLFPPRHVLHLETDEGAREVELDQVVSIEVQSHTLKLRLAGQADTLLAGGYTLSELAAELEPKGFLRLQKSYLVNMRHIRSIKNYRVAMSNGDVIKASERNYARVKNRYVLWRGEQL